MAIRRRNNSRFEPTSEVGYWGATEQKTRLRIQATSTIKSDGLTAVSGMAAIRDRVGHMGLQGWGQSNTCLSGIELTAVFQARRPEVEIAAAGNVRMADQPP
jgi:hypothetical protein